MKKWKILIPSLVATASMPLIGLVGCGEEPIDWGTICQLDTKWDFPLEGEESAVDTLSTNELVSLKAGEKYTFVINLEDWTASMDPFDKTWTLCFWSENLPFLLSVDVDYDSIRVWRNMKEQKLMNLFSEETGLDDFCIYSRTEPFSLIGLFGYHMLTPPLMTDEYRIQFVVNTDINDIRVYFTDQEDIG